MSSSPPDPSLSARLSPVWRVEFASQSHKPEAAKEDGPVAKAAQELADKNREQVRAELAPGQLFLQVDSDAGRFVQTLKDSATSEVIWKYPSESQLAYSRAVRAYMRAISGG